MNQLNIKNNVLIGKEGWLFLHQGSHGQFSYLLQDKVINNQRISIFEENLRFRKSFCENRKIKYKHTVFPSKPLLKFKFLPEQAQNVKSLYNSYFSKNEDVYYPLKELLDGIEPYESTFKKFDTHMTDTAYWSIASQLVEFAIPGIDTQVEFNKISMSMNCDLSKMLALNDVSEELVLQLPKQCNFNQFNNFTALKGNSGRVKVIHCLNPKTEYRLLIFGDSFFSQIVKFFVPFFRDIVFLRTPVFHGEIVEMYSPDVVFTGNAERYLPSVKSDDLAQPFLLSNVFMEDYNPPESFVTAFSGQLSFRNYPKQYEKWTLAQKKE